MQQNAILREKYEWSNIWWDHADDISLKRVLLIGDSISVGYTQTVINQLQGAAHVDRLANSRGVNDPALVKEITYMLGEYRYAAIHFNNGLHGFHIPDDVYACCIRQLVQILMQYGQGAGLVWASSTPVTVPGDPSTLDEEKNTIVLRRNALAADIMQDYDIPTNDLYSVVAGRPQLSTGDGYHYNAEGYALLGESVVRALRAALSV